MMKGLMEQVEITKHRRMANLARLRSSASRRIGDVALHIDGSGAVMDAEDR